MKFEFPPKNLYFDFYYKLLNGYLSFILDILEVHL